MDRVAPAAIVRRAVSPVTRLSSISDVAAEHGTVGRHALAGPTSSRSPGFNAATGTLTSSPPVEALRRLRL